MDVATPFLHTRRSRGQAPLPDLKVWLAFPVPRRNVEPLRDRFPFPARWSACLALLVSAAVAAGQGTFQNLGFESATLIPAGGEQFFDFSQAFPGWTGYLGGVPQEVTAYNGLTLGSAGFSLIDSAYQAPYGSTGGLIQGAYTAVLMSGRNGPDQLSTATIAQTSLVPIGAESLRFRAHFEGHDSLSSFTVTLGNQPLFLVPVASGANYTLYAADVHAYGGQTAELGFTVHAYLQQFAPDYLFLDSIQFSTQPIPEPSVVALSAGGALLLCRRFLGGRKHHRPKSGGVAVIRG